MEREGAVGWRDRAAYLLLCLAWFYPCWWLAQLLVSAGPELLRGALAGDTPRVGVRGLGFSSWLGSSPSEALAALALAAAGWAGGMALARRAPALRTLGVLAAAWFAYALFGRGLSTALFRFEPSAAALAVAGFAALTFAFTQLQEAAPARGASQHAAWLIMVFLAPLAAAHAAPALWRGDLRMFGLAQAVGGVLGAVVLAGFFGKRNRVAAAPRGSLVIAGAVASIAVFVAAERLGRTLEASAEARRQASLAPVPRAAPPPRAGAGFFYKGVNFTAEWPDPYGSKVAARVLGELPGYGVNAVALVPYASQRLQAAELNFPLRMERDELVVATAKMAHAEGLRVLLKPQVWVRGGSFPGDLVYDDAAERGRWFASYARFVEHYAKLAARIDAEMFCVGVEFAQLSRHEREWRELIALARKHYSGPLVYAANFGEELESVRFWDALDFIGLDNYYPLPEDRSTVAIAEKIERVHLEFDKPVLFTEAGFSTYELAHRRPWEDEPGGALSPQTQARNVDAFLRGYYGRPWLRGIFWWKVGTAGRGGPEDGSHILWGKPAMDVLGQWFLRPPSSRVYE